MKKIIVYLMVAIRPMVPFSFSILLTRIDRRLRFLVPLGKELVYNKYLNDLKVNVNTIYPIERDMLTGTYDPDTSAIIKRFIKQDSIAIDVGANIGALTLLMAKIANLGKVISIEPGPPICSRLKSNLELNPEVQKVVEVFQVGLSNKKGELFWAEDDSNRGNAGLSQDEGVAVIVHTLDYIVDLAKLEKIDFIKIDVEGMELEVIKGGMDSIIKYRPIIYFETMEAFRDYRGFDCYGEIFTLLHNIDYKHFTVLSDGKLAEVSSLDVLRSQNTIGIPNEKAIFST
jgi:FkbM family methyltransferase